MKPFGCRDCKAILWTDFDPKRPISHYCEICKKETWWDEVKYPQPHHDCIECKEKCKTPNIDGYTFRCQKRWKNVMDVPKGETDRQNVDTPTGTGNLPDQGTQGTQGPNV